MAVSAPAPSSEVRPAARADAAATPVVHPGLVTLAISVGSIMGALDMSIVNVAIPYIRANMGATFEEIAWISTAYIIAMVIVMPMTAWLAVTFGRKRLYMFSLALFTVASLLCGVAGSLWTLVFFRFVQGLGAGVLMPTQQAILRETYPAEKQAQAMGIFGVAVMIGPAIGPTLGGWITDNYNWPWIFYINVPVGCLALWLVQQFIHDPDYMRARRSETGFDGLGVALLAIGLAAMQVVLEEGERYDWFESVVILGLAVISVVTLAVFIWWELRAPKPVVDLSVLKNASFSTGTFIGGILGVGLMASMFLLPVYMQELLGYPATKSGFALMPRSIAMVLFMPIAGALYNRVGPRVMIGTGLAIAGMAPVMMSRFTLDTGDMALLWPQVVQGVGFTFVFVALSTTALSALDKRKLTGAAGLYNLVRQLGGSFGTAIFASLLTRFQDSSRSILVEHLNVYNPLFRHRIGLFQGYFMSQGADRTTAAKQALAMMDGVVSQQAAVLAFERSFAIIAVLFFLCLPLVLLLKSPARQKAAAAARAHGE